jgi:hypothetical protein
LHRDRQQLSGNEDSGAFKAACAEISKRLVGLLERIARRPGYDTHLGRQAQEIYTILPCKIGD